MAIALMDPEGLPRVDVTRQVSVATGSGLVFVAGRVARDADGNTVGEGDPAAQTGRCYLNVAAPPAAAGGSFADVAKLTAYVPDWAGEKMPPFEEGVARASARLGVGIAAPLSLIGIGAAFSPDLLVEVEAVAVID